MSEQQHIQELLKRHLGILQARNPKYSIRAFAKKLELSSGTVSLVLLGKRKVSRKLASKIANKLTLDPQERSEIMEKFVPQLKSTNEDDRYLQLSSDKFNVISEWYYFGILNLIKTTNFKSNKKWIAKRFGISELKVSTALDRLERLELIKIDKNGLYRRSSSKFRTSDDIENMALKKSHHETLNLATHSLESDEIDQRDFTCVTFSFDPERMKEAKSLIRKFQDEFLEIVQHKSNPSEVYRMAVQLFPLTRLDKSGEKK